MRRLFSLIALVCAPAAPSPAARCTTVADPRALGEYETYVAAAERLMTARFEAGDLAWLPDSARMEAAAELASGKPIRRNISDTDLNRRLADENATVIDWAGAIRIRRVDLAVLRAVLEDYGRYDSIYRPMIFECRARRTADASYEATFGLHNKYRYASLFPQHYAFRVRSRIDYSQGAGGGAPELFVRMRSGEIRESDSGVPGRTDFLEPYHDHGIMWALNAWWRARQQGPDVYLEFETVTLARSVREFVCKLGIIPVPKAIVAGAMDSIPAESVELVLAATRAECERRASAGQAKACPTNVWWGTLQLALCVIW